MHAIAEIIAVLKDHRSGINGEMERETALRPFGSRVHAGFHEAFADGGVVTELG
jgi:hypothetical protein